MMLTPLPVSTVFDVKVPVAADASMVTRSLPAIPTRAAAPVFNAATSVRSYTRLTAVTLLTVSSFLVMVAFVVGWATV